MPNKHPINLIVQVDAQSPADIADALTQLAYTIRQGTHEVADRQEGKQFDVIYQLKEK